VTTRELASKYPHYLTVDRTGFRLRYYRRLRLVKSYTIAVGQVGFDTPAGLYHIQNKAIDPAWSVPEEEWAGKLAGRTISAGSPGNPIKARWMGIYDGAGIHGTDETGSLGSAASHGCIRMAIPDVKELYRRIKVDTPVYIS
jgi:lipoprotein-anchoring transpeptidase ErfK/SrfK